MSELSAKESPKGEGSKGSKSQLERRYWSAMTLYAILGGLAWLTIGEGSILVGGKPLELRMVPVAIMAIMALRTVLALQADRIRRKG